MHKMKMKMREVKLLQKSAKKGYQAISEKVLHLETPIEEGEANEVIKFRREFAIPPLGFKIDPKFGYSERDQWYLNLVQDIKRYERYQQRLSNLAKKFGFKSPEEKHILEFYLQTGDPIVRGGLLEQNPKTYQLTRVWEQADTARRIRDKLDSGMKYEDVAEFYNKIRPPGSSPVTVVKLRQIMSRAEDRVGKRITRS